MKATPKSEIARFSPAAAIAAQAPSLAVGVFLATAALAFAFTILTSDSIGPRRFSGPLMLILFAVAAVCIFGRGLLDAVRSGPAVEVEDGRLKAFTGGIGEMPLSEVVRANVTGGGSSRRVVVFGQSGPRLVIRADLMKPDARSIADGIMDAKSAHFV
jgi:hypothetical protein